MKIEHANLTITLDGAEYSAQPATIRSTMLGVEDHGIMSFWLHCEWPGSGVGVGGFSLDDKPAAGDRFGRRRPHAICGHVIAETLTCVGVSSWEKLTGQRCHVLFDGPHLIGSHAVGIANADLTRGLIYEHLIAAFEET